MGRVRKWIGNQFVRMGFQLLGVRFNVPPSLQLQNVPVNVDDDDDADDGEVYRAELSPVARQMLVMEPEPRTDRSSPAPLKGSAQDRMLKERARRVMGT